jgi:hypothetical protein
MPAAGALSDAHTTRRSNEPVVAASLRSGARATGAGAAAGTTAGASVFASASATLRDCRSWHFRRDGHGRRGADRTEREPAADRECDRCGAEHELLHHPASENHRCAGRARRAAGRRGLREHGLPRRGEAERRRREHGHRRREPHRQRAPQHREPAVQPHLHGAERHVEAVRDLLQLEPVHEPQRQHLPVVARQRLHRSRDRFEALVRFGPRFRRLALFRRDTLRIGHAHTLAPRTPHVVAEQADQPRCERPRAVPPLPLPDRVDERRLHEILGGAAAREVRRDEQQLARELVEHRRERVGVAGVRRTARTGSRP